MKNSKANTNYTFWFLIAIMIITVIGITTGTYFQYKIAMNNLDINESTSITYSVIDGTKNFIFLVGTFF